ncbi:MAG: Fur family transcriptional regulator [Succinivibrionaceae bacterium]
MRSSYKTRQKEELLEYLASIPGKHVTVADIVLYFNQRNIDISTTTVYRNLESLVDEGLVNKYQFDRNTCACFEFINKAEHCHLPKCFHCKCSVCGNLFHIESSYFKNIAKDILSKYDFEIDPQRTVFYGTCKKCSKKDNHESNK